MLLEGALILLAGILIGRFMPGRRRKRSHAQPKPVCGCGHHHSYHDPKTSACHGSVYELGIYVRCPCRRYSGPEPLPEYVAPEIAGGSGA